MNIHVFPALNGDCILIESNDGHHILIDGGYIDTYREYLLPKLRELSEEGYHLDLLVVTHIDSDHISGIIKLLEETPDLISIDNIWYNGYRHIQDGIHNESLQPEDVLHGNICKESIKDDAKPISAKQGCTLSSLIAQNNIKWNGQFGYGLIQSPCCVNIDGMIFHILSPSAGNISDLQRLWKRDLIKGGLLKKAHSNEFWDDAFEFLLSKDKPGFRFHNKQVSAESDFELIKQKSQYTPDTSCTNGSSISFIVEIDGKKLLFLGDAKAETIINSLEGIYGKNYCPVFDAIKLSHHGSFNNNSPELISKIDSINWIVSTNGEVYGHPDIETLSFLLTKDKNNERHIYFNYDLPICNRLMEYESNATFQYKIIPPQLEHGVSIPI